MSTDRELPARWFIEIHTPDRNLAERILDRVPGLYELEMFSVHDPHLAVFAGEGTPSSLTDPTGTAPMVRVVEEDQS